MRCSATSNKAAVAASVAAAPDSGLPFCEAGSASCTKPRRSRSCLPAAVGLDHATVDDCEAAADDQHDKASAGNDSNRKQPHQLIHLLTEATWNEQQHHFSSPGKRLQGGGAGKSISGSGPTAAAGSPSKKQKPTGDAAAGPTDLLVIAPTAAAAAGYSLRPRQLSYSSSTSSSSFNTSSSLQRSSSRTSTAAGATAACGVGGATQRSSRQRQANQNHSNMSVSVQQRSNSSSSRDRSTAVSQGATRGTHSQGTTTDMRAAQGHRDTREASTRTAVKLKTASSRAQACKKQQQQDQEASGARGALAALTFNCSADAAGGQ